MHINVLGGQRRIRGAKDVHDGCLEAGKPEILWPLWLLSQKLWDPQTKRVQRCTWLLVKTHQLPEAISVNPQ